MNLSSHLLVLKMTVLIFALRGGGQCSQVNVLSRETFGDTVDYEWSHYSIMDNIVHVCRWIGNAEQFILVLPFLCQVCLIMATEEATVKS